MSKTLKAAMALVTAGLCVALLSQLMWSPGAFVVYATVGVPLTLLGIFAYVIEVLRIIRSKGAL